MTPADDQPSSPPEPSEVREPPERLRYPQTREAYLAAVQVGLDDLDAGREISGEAVFAWMRSWFTDEELPPPKCGD